MKSIRPLVTIVLLAVVSVFLYFKINDTEPMLPDDMSMWNMNDQVEIGSLAEAVSTRKPTPYGAVNESAPLNVQPPDTQTLGNQLPSTSRNSTPDWADSPVKSGPPEHAVPRAFSPVTPAPASERTTSESTLFSATRQAAQEALDRGELSQALELLSDWYGDPSLSREEHNELQTLLGQLAGSVIYSGEHRLESPYLVQADETLEDVAKKFNVSWQLLAKINGITQPVQLRPGQTLKVVRGPFSALIDLSNHQLTLMLDRRYAGKYSIDVEAQTVIEEGHWRVDQKLIAPGNVGLNPAFAAAPPEEESLVLINPTKPAGQVAVLCGEKSSVPTTESANSAIRIRSKGIEELFDILSVGSRVIIRR